MPSGEEKESAQHSTFPCQDLTLRVEWGGGGLGKPAAASHCGEGP